MRNTLTDKYHHIQMDPQHYASFVKLLFQHRFDANKKTGAGQRLAILKISCVSKKGKVCVSD